MCKDKRVDNIIIHEYVKWWNVKRLTQYFIVFQMKIKFESRKCIIYILMREYVINHNIWPVTYDSFELNLKFKVLENYNNKLC